MATATPAGPAARTIDLSLAAVLSIFLVLAALIFLAIYLALPENNHFTALLTIGSLSLVFALGAYLAEALSRAPIGQRALAYAFMGMGFATLLLTVGLGPSSAISNLGRLVGVILILLLLAAVGGGIAWRQRSAAADRSREAQRTNWRASSPPSAFEYTTARPNAPPPTPSRPVQSSPPPPPGAA